MDRKDKMLVGALVPKNYGKELFDKLNNSFPHRRKQVVPMTYLVRTLLGMWFDGKIDVNMEDINAYKADHRKTNRLGNQVLDAAHKAGQIAAAEQLPINVNPYDPSTKSWELWNSGWKHYFNS